MLMLLSHLNKRQYIIFKEDYSFFQLVELERKYDWLNLKKIKNADQF